MTVPGWPSLEPAVKEKEPDPYPGCVSEFDEKIRHYEESVSYAVRSIHAIRGCIELEKKKIKENEKYIRRCQGIIQEYQNELKNAKLSEKRKKALREKVEETKRNIESTQEDIGDSQKSITAAEHLLPGWQEELVHRSKIRTRLKQERLRGIDQKTGQPKKCKHRNKDEKTDCKNENHFRKGEGWGPCYRHYKK